MAKTIDPERAVTAVTDLFLAKATLHERIEFLVWLRSYAQHMLAGNLGACVVCGKEMILQHQGRRQTCSPACRVAKGRMLRRKN